MPRSSTPSARRKQLRLVAGNPAANRRLMPIGELDARLKEIDRILSRGSADPRNADPALRDTLLRQRNVIRCELAARPFNPAQARRCEQQLRWLIRETRSRSTGDRSPRGWRAWFAEKASHWFDTLPTARA